MAVERPYVATKVPQFSWTRLAGADPFLGVEMSSTGEIACFGKDLIEAYWTSLQATMNFRVPEPGEGLLFGGDVAKPELAAVVDYLQPLGYKLYAADAEVKEHLESATKREGVSVEVVEFPVTDKRALRDVFKKYDIRGVFNLASQRGKDMQDKDYVMRRNAVDFGVPLFMEPKVCFSPILNSCDSYDILLHLLTTLPFRIIISYFGTFEVLACRADRASSNVSLVFQTVQEVFSTNNVLAEANPYSQPPDRPPFRPMHERAPPSQRRNPARSQEMERVDRWLHVELTKTHSDGRRTKGG